MCVRAYVRAYVYVIYLKVQIHAADECVFYICSMKKIGQSHVK